MAVGTTRGKRRLGRYIRPLMERSGLTPKEVATQARCAQQTVTRLLSGDSLPRIHLFLMILSVLDVREDERAKAVQLWEVADADTATIEHAAELPVSYRRFRIDEREGRLERTLDAVIIPGLLQTPEYAAANASKGRVRGNWDAEAEAAERRDRQGLLHRPENPLELHALIDEAVLRRVIGGSEVMAGQLDHLLAMAALPHVTVQVIPFDVGAYGAMSGPLVLLSFPEDDEPDSAYVESLIGMHTVENQVDVSALSAVWDGAAAMARSPEETITIIRALRGNLDGHG
ncbi:helix-turn-helix domain-containing protein [Labedaea rhizosphaerae]|uniref:Helix-turn-helix protein n=1 Tax=Labedaea rhizosphaerae TaxID=598644 RepID=A0A4R6SHJ0_LABRH|nr:helix-turn-helix transcriptional regulator [Labedaea rhizosphaerae]TDQ01275.1 helix-turn-helix protein [Labedaea rhizosphaerae]